MKRPMTRDEQISLMTGARQRLDNLMHTWLNKAQIRAALKDPEGKSSYEQREVKKACA